MKIMKQSISDQMFSILKEAIVRQRIKAGEQINPREMAEQYGVSVMPVRDALTRLASFGLVTIRPRVGFFAREFTPDEVREILEVRRLHEVYCLDHYFSQIDLDELQRIKQDMDAYEANPTPEAFDRIDEELHDLFLAASQNRFLMENYQQVKELLILIRNVDAARMRYSHVEHRKIVEAVLRGHKELAVRYLEQHLDNARHATLRSTAAMDGLG